MKFHARAGDQIITTEDVGLLQTNGSKNRIIPAGTKGHVIGCYYPQDKLGKQSISILNIQHNYRNLRLINKLFCVYCCDLEQEIVIDFGDRTFIVNDSEDCIDYVAAALERQVRPELLESVMKDFENVKCQFVLGYFGEEDLVFPTAIVGEGYWVDLFPAPGVFDGGILVPEQFTVTVRVEEWVVQCENNKISMPGY